MLRKSHPNILTNIEGEALEAKEGNATLLNAFLLALLTMYALMAIPFRSYVQPDRHERYPLWPCRCSHGSLGIW